MPLAVAQGGIASVPPYALPGFSSAPSVVGWAAPAHRQRSSKFGVICLDMFGKETLIDWVWNSDCLYFYRFRAEFFRHIPDERTLTRNNASVLGLD